MEGEGRKRVERKVESPAYCEWTIWKIHVSAFGLNLTDRSEMLLGKGRRSSLLLAQGHPPGSSASPPSKHPPCRSTLSCLPLVIVPGVPSLSISEAGPLKSRRCGTVECYLTAIKRRQNSRRARQARELAQPKNPSWMPSVLLLPPEPIKQEPQSSSSSPDSLVLYESHFTQCLWYLATRQIRLSLLDPHNLQTQHHPP